jgi:uncharacterized protein YndB with AHSA1/START domain
MNNSHVCTIFIKASPEKVWAALTQSQFTSQYFHATNIESTWEKDAIVTYYNQDGSVAVAGKILASEFPTRLSFTWHVHYNPDAFQEQPSRVTFQLEPVEDATKLTLFHDQFPKGSVVLPQITEGWIAILSNMKTLLETGTVMAVS